MARQEQLVVEEYARMWPREVFDRLILAGCVRALPKRHTLLHRTGRSAPWSAMAPRFLRRCAVSQFLEFLLRVRGSRQETTE
jgi:hypothetical protein